MRPRRPDLRDDLERALRALDRGPHTRDELAEATGIAPDAVETRVGTLRSRGWVTTWGDEEPVLALTWPGRYALHRRRFQAAALGSLALGLAFAAGLAALTPAGPPGEPAAGGHGDLAAALATGAVGALAITAVLLRTAPD